MEARRTSLGWVKWTPCPLKIFSLRVKRQWWTCPYLFSRYNQQILKILICSCFLKSYLLEATWHQLHAYITSYIPNCSTNIKTFGKFNRVLQNNIYISTHCRHKILYSHSTQTHMYNITIVFKWPQWKVCDINFIPIPRHVLW